MQLLLIELEPASSALLAERLMNSGFRMHRSNSIGDVILSGLGERASVLILDIGAMKQEGAAIVGRLRDAGVESPLIVLSAGGDWRDKVSCLDAGADDFLFKPLRSEEIAARVRAIVRRSSGNSTDQIVAGNLELDLKSRCAWLSGKCLDLTRSEFRLLRLFLLCPDQVLTHQEIRDKLYPDGSNCSLNAIEVQIARLRRKIGKSRIRSIRGVGYRHVNVPGPAASEEATKSPCKSGWCCQSNCELSRQ